MAKQSRKNLKSVSRKNSSKEEMQVVNKNVDVVEPQKKSSRIYYVLAVVVLLFVAIYFGFQKYGRLAVVSTVNGAPIFRWDLWTKLEKQSGKQILEQMVSEKLIDQEAEKKQIVVAKADVDNQIKQFEKQFKGKAGLDQMLSFQGLTRKDLEEQIRYNLILTKLTTPAKVTDKEIQEYYDANQSTYGEELTGDARQKILEVLNQQKKSKAITDWFDAVRKKAKVVNNLE